MYRLIMIFLAAFAAASCAASNAATYSSGTGFIQGQARVVSVDQTLGQAVLEIGGQHVLAYWQTELTTTRPGAVVRNGPLNAPVGVYNELLVRHDIFPGEPGDLIAFVALQTGKDLFLRGVTVIAHHP